MFGTECKDRNKLCENHNKYKSDDSDTFKKLNDTFRVKYGTGKVTGISSEDTVYLAAGLEAKKQMFGAARKVTKEYIGYDGILGKVYYSIISLVEHQGTLYSKLSLVEHQGTLYSIISLVEHQGILYSILSLVEHQGIVEIFVLTSVIKY